jgi:hypothetical protein
VASRAHCALVYMGVYVPLVRLLSVSLRAAGCMHGLVEATELQFVSAPSLHDASPQNRFLEWWILPWSNVASFLTPPRPHRTTPCGHSLFHPCGSLDVITTWYSFPCSALDVARMCQRKHARLASERRPAVDRTKAHGSIAPARPLPKPACVFYVWSRAGIFARPPACLPACW